ncbi:hypothetical protein D4L85_02165 [Chryseolinea soli]|uniref:Uncharacterized protein n=1 Tax=Chryseolinea soli TaxID=2321403 RepID=A0A385SKC7_9BACT|nr:hypothetical protein D4L85_02165 [Chryseolinea soli]
MGTLGLGLGQFWRAFNPPILATKAARYPNVDPLHARTRDFNFSKKAKPFAFNLPARRSFSEGEAV